MITSAFTAVQALLNNADLAMQQGNQGHLLQAIQQQISGVGLAAAPVAPAATPPATRVARVLAAR